MTVTVIIIIAVIVVLAVLVLLLLGMRALSLGSREDDYDDYEYDDIEDDRDDRRDRGRGRARDDGPEEEDGSRPRGRRPRQSDGKAERRPKGRRQRGVDWEDDSDGLSDNDFWSSLSEDGPTGPGPGPGPRGRDAFGAGETDGHASDYDEPEYADPVERGPVDDPAPRLSDGFDDASDQVRTPPGTTSDLAMLASLGQGGDPIPQPERPSDPGRRPAALEPGPSGGALPPTQSLPQNRPAPAIPPAPPADDPLGPGSWSASPPSTGDPFEGREPLTPAERSGLLDGPPPAGRGHDGGAHTLGRAPSTGGAGDPLDPGFRPGQSSGQDLGSPIWSSMDTGAHQRSDLSGYGGGAPGSSGGFGGPSDPGAVPTPGQPMGGPSVPGHHAPGADPLTGGYPTAGPSPSGPYDPSAATTDSFTRSEYDTGSFARPGYDTGTHTRPGGPSPYDSGTHNRPSGLGGPSPYDSGSFTRPEYDTDSFARPGYDTGTHTRPGGPSPYDSGTHNRPTGLGGPSPYDSGSFTRPEYDTGTHTRPGGLGAPSPNDSGTPNRPTGLGDPSRFDTPGAPGGPPLPGGPGIAGTPGGPSAGNPPLWEDPRGGAYDAPGRPVPGPGAPGRPPAPPTGGYPTDPGYGTGAYQGGPPGGAPYQERPQQTDPFGRPLGQAGPQGPGGPGYQGGPGHPGGQSDHSDMLGGDFPPSDYGYPPAQDWRPGDEEPGDGRRHSGPAPRAGQGPHGHDHRSGYGQEYYEGGYEDGQYR